MQEAISAVCKQDAWRLEQTVACGLNGEGASWALNVAVESGYTDMVEILLKVDGMDAKLGELLCDAARRGHAETAELLIDRGADIQHRSGAPLAIAVAEGREAVFGVLLKKGADIHANNDSALRCAAQFGRTDMLKTLIALGGDMATGNGYPLKWSAANGFYDAANILLINGADIHAEDDVALRMAAQNGHTQVVRLLLDRDANIHAREDEALMLAVEQGRAETARLLLRRGADARAQEGLALCLAADTGNAAIAGMLIAHGARVDAADHEALLLAAARGHDAVVETLLENGADVTARGKSALLLARQAQKDGRGNAGRALALLERAFEAHKEDVRQIRRGQFEDRFGTEIPDIEELLKPLDETGKTGLVLAAEAGLFAKVADTLPPGGVARLKHDLIRGDTAGMNVLRALGENDMLDTLFTARNWTGAAAEMTALYDRLPESYRKQVDLESVVSRINVKCVRRIRRGRNPGFGL